jgi:hypothetical protein
MEQLKDVIERWRIHVVKWVTNYQNRQGLYFLPGLIARWYLIR